MIQERDRTQSLLDNLQTLLLSRDQQDAEARRKLEMDVRALRDENTAARLRVDEARAETQRERAGKRSTFSSSVSSLKIDGCVFSDRDAREKEFGLLLEAKEKQLLDTREQLSKAQAEIHTLTVLSNQLRGQLSEAQQVTKEENKSTFFRSSLLFSLFQNLNMMLRTTVTGKDPSGAPLTALQKAEFELEAARTELLNLKEEIATEKALVTQYKDMAQQVMGKKTKEGSR